MSQQPKTAWRGSRAGQALSLSLAVGLAAWATGPARPVHAGAPLLLLGAASAGQSDTGSIKGKVVWGGSEAPKPAPLVEKGGASKDPSVCAANSPIPNNELAVDPETKGLRYAFAYLVSPKAKNPDAVKALVEKHPKVEIDQKNCEFLPFGTIIHQDQTLVFKSSDPVNHNVHLSPFTNAPFNLILAPNGETEKKLVAERRPIPVTCDIHPWMRGYVMVLDHPFFAVSGKDGTFEIKGVPPGTYNLAVWHHYGYLTPGLARGTPIQVKAGEAADAGTVTLDPSKVKK